MSGTTDMEPGDQASGAATAPLRVVSVGKTDVGREREVNEDAMFVDPEGKLFLVCDGMGGHSSGQLASRMAVHAIINTVYSERAQAAPDENLVIALQEANRAVFTHAHEDQSCRGMGTTAVGMRIDGKNAHVCHVGDSRLYRLRGNNFQLLTRDHSLSNLYADKPELEGRLGPATTNVIVRAIGLEPQVAVDHRIIALEEDDLFLLCCDGLNDLVDDSLIRDMMLADHTLEEMAEQMVATANRNGGTDNITVILVAVSGADGTFVEGRKTTVGY